jgi:AcrR family transcriptional regulator
MGRPREHDEATAAALLKSAEQLLVHGGPDALSVRQVADAVGTSTRAVYSLFGDKDGLVRALYRSSFETLKARVESLPQTADPAADLVRAGIDGFRHHALAHPYLFQLAFEWRGRRAKVSDADRAVGLASFRALVAKVERAVGAGAIHGHPETIALGFHALCQGLASGEIAGWIVQGADPVALWRQTLSAYVDGWRRPRD